MDSKQFFAELKRRNVIKVAIGYGVVGWLVVQIATQILPFFEIPSWAVRLIVILLLLGLPIPLVFAWIYEITPQGLKRTEDVPLHDSIVRTTGRKLDFAIIGVLLVVIAFLIFPRTERRSQGSGSFVPKKSIAVLPFENFSDKENSFFAEGMQDDVLNTLAKIKDLKVISRTSVLQYRGASGKRNLREIGRALGVANILEGSVRRLGDRVVVNVQLV
ncbi:MAG: tetratricopeptide repeat protein, partial [Chthoniobacterales bacterium]